MNLALIIEVSRSLLVARWRQTLVAAIGVTFSITMFIALLSFMSGLNKMLDGLVLNRTPHIRLYKEVQPSADQPVTLSAEHKNSYAFIRSVKPKVDRLDLYDSKAIRGFLAKDDRVEGFSPRLSTQVFYNIGALDLSGNIDGVDPDEENRLFRFSDYVVTGNYLDLKWVPNSIILGKELAKKMLANPGDVIQVTTPKGEQVMLKVVGYFQSGIRDYDLVQSYASIATVQKLLGENTGFITGIQVKLHDIREAPQLAAEYRKLFGLQAIDIQTANGEFETGSFIRSLISYVVGITLLVVAGFGIYNILNMMIYEKMDSIAILKATGFSGNDIKAIFLTIALGIGLFGGVTGLLLGYLLSVVISHIPFVATSLPTITTYPVDFNPAFYLIGLVFSTGTTYLAGYLPSRKASKIDPVDIIRGK